MTIGEFLLELATNQRKLDAFIENPGSAVEQAGLDPKQRELLLAGDLRKLRITIEAEFNIGDENFVIHFIWLVPTICIVGPPSSPTDPSQE